VTIRKPVSEAKSKLNELIRQVELEGVEIVLLRHGQECARLVPAKPPAEPLRLMGFARDLISLNSVSELQVDESAWGDIDVDGRKISLK
jgi:prevent-host-death family protein